jgi:hypothetical protein
MAIRIASSLYFAFDLEPTPVAGAFIRDLIKIDLNFLKTLAKRKSE